MSKPKPRKSRDELIQSGIKMFKALPNIREQLASGELTEEDIWYKASEWADKQIEKRESRLAGEAKVQEAIKEDDEEYREKQEREYRKNFEWTSANDEASLRVLLDLEVQMRQLNDEIGSERDPEQKDKMRRTLAQTSREHRTLQEKLGIDRLSRSKAAATRSVIDDWDRIKKDASQKLEALAAEFEEKAEKVASEAELRDRMKYHFAIPHAMVDTVLSNHRRVLGLDLDVQKS